VIAILGPSGDHGAGDGKRRAGITVETPNLDLSWYARNVEVNLVFECSYQRKLKAESSDEVISKAISSARVRISWTSPGCTARGSDARLP
jgi:hypothetical protein